MLGMERNCPRHLCSVQHQRDVHQTSSSSGQSSRIKEDEVPIPLPNAPIRTCSYRDAGSIQSRSDGVPSRSWKTNGRRDRQQQRNCISSSENFRDDIARQCNIICGHFSTPHRVRAIPNMPLCIHRVAPINF